jgi:hypothetical protein
MTDDSSREAPPPSDLDPSGTGSPPLKRGWARARELSIAAEAERKAIEEGLFASLGRTPTAVDVIAIETLSSAFLGARRKRAAGRNDLESLKLITQLLRATGLRPAPPKIEKEFVNPFAGLFADEEEDGGEAVS